MTEFPSLRRLNVSYTLVHVVYWAMFAIFAGYQTSLLLGRGFTSGEAGIFASIRCFAGILAQPLLGGWADRHPEVPIKRLLNACLVLALGVNVVFYTTRPGFWGTALIFLTLGILELNAYPLLDSMAVQFIAAGVDMSYSLSRGLGSLSYALACVACGQQAVRFGTESLLLTHMALLVLMIAVVALYPAFPKDALQAQGGGERPHSILYILKSSRPFTLTLVSLFFTLAAIMPIWLMKQPRDYMTTIMFVCMIAGAIIGLVIGHPTMELPAFTGFNNEKLGTMFPILFVTVACGAVSGFHSLVSSGTSSKTIANEKDMLKVGYGAMILESVLAVLALCVAGAAAKNGVAASVADGLGIGLGYTISLTFLGSLREILGNGTWFGHPVMWDGFQPFTIMVQAPGAFICLGLILAGMNVINVWQSRRKGGQMVETSSCGGCKACSMFQQRQEQ